MSNTTPLTTENLLIKLLQFFDSFDKFDYSKYFVAETSYELEKTEAGEEITGMGYVEGGISWKGHNGKRRRNQFRWPL